MQADNLFKKGKGDKMAEKMRTRCLPSMTNGEVEKYLERNDIIVVPIGVSETHGMYPLDCEYVMAEAYARLIAEQVDGLVLPNLVYFHPGATQIGRGTVHMSMRDGFNYVTAIAESLLQQGFRRQIYIPGHEPISQFLLPMITQFFDDNKVPLFYCDIMAYLQKKGLMEPFGARRNKPLKPISDENGMGDHARMIGAYKICGRLDDFPTGAEVNDERYIRGSYEKCEADIALERLLEDKTTLISVSPAFYYTDVAQHGSHKIPETREEILHEAEVGEAYLRNQIANCDFVSKMEDLKVIDRHMNSTIMELHGNKLPRNKWSPNIAKEV